MGSDGGTEAVLLREQMAALEAKLRHKTDEADTFQAQVQAGQRGQDRSRRPEAKFAAFARLPPPLIVPSFSKDYEYLDMGVWSLWSDVCCLAGYLFCTFGTVKHQLSVQKENLFYTQMV